LYSSEYDAATEMLMFLHITTRIMLK